MIVAVFKPQSPAVKPNPTNVLEGTIATKSDYVFLTPTFIEASTLGYCLRLKQ